jgi:DNA primase|tara:strand:+ start:638 stop:2383 length:1746 start_codon:yes stop_codon:yes gene_type:complete
MKIAQDIIDRVRDTADIVDVISQYVDLKQRGANFFGLCPFHGEKTASFSVAPAKQIYHCFGCSSGGNVYSFIMEYQKIPFPEAIKVLADKYNIPIQIEKDSGSNELFSSLYELHDIATKLYQNNLFSEKGKHALSYLNSRGLSEDIIKQFKIGLSFNRWDHLVSQCKGKGFTNTQIIQSGLFTHSDKGIFDRFRSRIMFPIFHSSGKTIAFGGRIHEAEDIAKYLNSPETPLYKKSDVFYGLHASRDAIRKKGYAILVEGYMDYLKFYQNSIHNVIAVSGTAFTVRHAIVMGRIAEKVILLYDGDSAGANAAIRAGWVLLQAGIEPLIVRPPEGQDPDDWVTNEKKENILKKLESPMTYLDYHLDLHQGLTLEGTDRRNYIIKLTKEIKSVEDSIIRNDMIRILSEKLKVDQEDLIRTMKSQNLRMTYETEEDQFEKSEPLFTTTIEKAQVELIQLLANEDINIQNYVKKEISIDLFTNDLLKKIAGFLMDENLKAETSSLMEYFQDKNEKNFIAKILFESEKNILTEEIVSDCLKILKSEPIKEQIKDIRIKIREKESKGQDSMQELNKLTTLRKALDEI